MFLPDLLFKLIYQSYHGWAKQARSEPCESNLGNGVDMVVPIDIVFTLNS